MMTREERRDGIARIIDPNCWTDKPFHDTRGDRDRARAKADLIIEFGLDGQRAGQP